MSKKGEEPRGRALPDPEKLVKEFFERPEEEIIASLDSVLEKAGRVRGDRFLFPLWDFLADHLQGEEMSMKDLHAAATDPDDFFDLLDAIVYNKSLPQNVTKFLGTVFQTSPGFWFNLQEAHLSDVRSLLEEKKEITE